VLSYFGPTYYYGLLGQLMICILLFALFKMFIFVSYFLVLVGKVTEYFNARYVVSITGHLATDSAR